MIFVRDAEGTKMTANVIESDPEDASDGAVFNYLFFGSLGTD
jgi:hypothetical protein